MMELTDDEVVHCINALEFTRDQMFLTPPAIIHRFGLQFEDSPKIKELSEKLVRYMDARSEARRDSAQHQPPEGRAYNPAEG